MKLKDIRVLDVFKFKNDPNFIYVFFSMDKAKEWYDANSETKYTHRRDLVIRKFVANPNTTSTAGFYKANKPFSIYGYAFDAHPDIFGKLPGWNYGTTQFGFKENVNPDTEVEIITRYRPDSVTVTNSIAKTVLNF